MAVREGDAGTGLEVAFEQDSASLVGKLDDHVEGPRTVLRRVHDASCVVFGKASFRIGSDSRVVPWRGFTVHEHVHEPLRHACDWSKALAGAGSMAFSKSPFVGRKIWKLGLSEAVHLRAPRYGGHPSREL